MPRYLDECRLGRTSESRLITCTADMQTLVRETIRRLPRHRDMSVVCGHRGPEEQATAFRLKRSSKRWPDSLHNQMPSPAVDVAPYNHQIRDIPWEDHHAFAWLNGFIYCVALELEIDITQGLDWDDDGLSQDHKLIDAPHQQRRIIA